VLRAPVAGLLDDLTIDPGECVSTGTDIGRIIDTDPLTIEVQVPQQTVGRVSAGQTAEVLFLTGEVRDGRVTYVSGSADAETRTFRAEVEVANFDGAIPAGISARLRVPTGEAVAHFISPAILSLGTDGALCQDRDRLRPSPSTRSRSSGRRPTPSGLGPAFDGAIITVGQGFVAEGEIVDPRPAEEIPDALVAPRTTADSHRRPPGMSRLLKALPDPASGSPARPMLRR
jgi:multidrug efflux system membrane fusion protein